MKESARIKSLDGFRAVAVAIVIVAHLSMLGAFPPLINLFVYKVFNGKIGVQFFFLLSGFLITYHLIREKERTGRINLRLFYLRRLLRIFPAFYTYLIVLALLNLSFGMAIPPSAFVSAAFFIYNFGLFDSNWFLNHSWTLGVEEQFYLLWPFLFKYYPELSSRNWWFLALLLGSIMRSMHYKYTDTSELLLADFFMYSDFLFSGCYIAHLYHYEKDRLTLKMVKIHPILSYVAILLIAFAYMVEFDPVYDKVTIPLAGTIANICECFLILYFVLNENTIGHKLLNSKLLSQVGKLSYGLYLWQQLFINPENNWFLSPWLAISFLLATAIASYHLIEKPFLRLKDKIASPPKTSIS